MNSCLLEFLAKNDLSDKFTKYMYNKITNKNMKKMELPFKYVDTNVKCYKPLQATGAAAGLDLPAAEDYTLEPNEIRIISTNIAVEIPYGYEGQIRGRSGLAFKNNVFCIHLGTIDSDYRGDVKVLLHNMSNKEFEIKAGDRIAQMIINKIEYVEPVEKQELSDTVRGESGFGSTGFQQTIKNALEAKEILKEETIKCRISNILDDCFEMLKKKNADYADYNIGPFSNFENVTKLGLDVKDSFFVRMTDKVSRIINLLDKNPTLTSETLVDTCMDLINYLVLYETYLSGVRTNDEFLEAIKKRFNDIKNEFINNKEAFKSLNNCIYDIDAIYEVKKLLFNPLKGLKDEDQYMSYNIIILIKWLIILILNKTK